MLFNSYIFIFLFFPVILAGYYLLGRAGAYRARNIFLIVMSLWFYGYFNYSYLPIICVSILINYLLVRFMERSTGQSRKKALLILGIVINTGIIFYYKYYDFFIENINALFRTNFALKHILLPLGISFFTFQQISYLVDSYRGETKNYSFDEYALFVSFFPQLIAGPIVLHDEMIPQFRDREKWRFIRENFSHGLFVFALGLFKKVIVADTFGAAVDAGIAGYDALSTLSAWISAFSYTLQLYFDFSGYSDMAIGLGLMMNIDIPQNFNSPYRALSIGDFWGRWHMTLTRFLRRYIYFPLGGSRKGETRTYLNIMAVFLVSGIWHGANWTFIVWGLLHGVLRCIDRAGGKYWERVWKPLRWAATFVTVTLLWVIFRSNDMGSAAFILKKLLVPSGSFLVPDIYRAFDITELKLIERLPGLDLLSSAVPILNMLIFFAGSIAAILLCPNSKQTENRPGLMRGVLTVLFMVTSIMSMANISTFLYFNF